MANRRFRDTPQPFEVDLDEITQTSEPTATILLVNARDRANLPTWERSDIVSIKPVELPLLPPGQIPGVGIRTDPRAEGAGDYYWLIGNDVLPSSPAGGSLEAATINDLTEVWRYKVTYQSGTDEPQTRTTYTTENDGAGRYPFTTEFIDAKLVEWSQEMGATYRGDGIYEATRVNQAATQITTRMSFDGGPIPADKRVFARDLFRDLLQDTTLESRRYSINDAMMAQLEAATDNILELPYYDSIEPVIVDGYTRGP